MSEPTVETVEPVVTPEVEPALEAPNKEAAKYRTQLRAAEAQRDAFAAVVGTYQRREVETLAETAGLTAGADLFNPGTETEQLAAMLAEDGTVDPDKVAEAVTTLTANRPHLMRAAIPKAPSTDGQGNVGTPINSGTPEVSWSNAFKA